MRPAPIQPIESERPTHPEVEFWFVSVANDKLNARVVPEGGFGKGEIIGYQILRNGSTSIDTISAAFKGGSGVGRGVYYLEKTYNGASHDREWWRGIHVEYDCEHGRVLTCPYVLGEERFRGKMSDDPWLKRSCAFEALPSNKSLVTVRQTIERGG